MFKINLLEFQDKHEENLLRKCAEYEELIDYEEMIYNAVKNKNTILIRREEDNKYSDLL